MELPTMTSDETTQKDFRWNYSKGLQVELLKGKFIFIFSVIGYNMITRGAIQKGSSYSHLVLLVTTWLHVELLKRIVH